MIPASTYATLIRAYVAGRLSGAEFEDLFLQLFKNDLGGRPQSDHAVLEALFEEVDAYCADPELRLKTVDGIGDEELKDAAREALARLDG